MVRLNLEVSRAKDARLARGGGVEEPAIDFIVQELQKVSGTTVSYASLKAHPLPTARPRVYFFLSRDPDVAAADLATEAEGLDKLFSKVHHVKNFVSAATAAEVMRAKSACDLAEEEARYGAAFSKALKGAIEAKRLSAEVVIPARADRPSFTCAASMKGMTPWFRSHSKLWDCEQQMMLSASSLLAIHGWNISSISTEGLSEKDLTDLAGRGMATTTLSMAMTPVLARLKYLVKA